MIFWTSLSPPDTSLFMDTVSSAMLSTIRRDTPQRACKHILDSDNNSIHGQGKILLQEEITMAYFFRFFFAAVTTANKHTAILVLPCLKVDFKKSRYHKNPEFSLSFKIPQISFTSVGYCFPCNTWYQVLNRSIVYSLRQLDPYFFPLIKIKSNRAYSILF